MPHRILTTQQFPERNLIFGGSISFTYKVTVPPANKPVDLALVKSYLKITDTSQDSIINLAIDLCTEVAECITKRHFITRESITFRNDFTDVFIIRRSPLLSVVKIERLVDGVFTLVDATLFSNTLETDYSKIFLLPDKCWPQDNDLVPQNIKITFKTGFGPDPVDVPSKIQGALLQHIANFFENRGDCPCDGSGIEAALPPQSKLVYETFKIMSVSVEPRVR